MKAVKDLYQYVNILSLDVVAGAVICAIFFGRIFGVNVAKPGLVALAVTVWIIYTIDHLRDAKSIPAVASTDRHRFHQKYFNLMLIILLCVIAADFVLIWFVPLRVMILGASLGCVVIVYLVLQRYLKFLKEVFVAILYTAGVLLPALSAMALNLSPAEWVLIFKFFITALMNLLVFSVFEYKEDRTQKQHSFVTWFGPASSRKGILCLGALNILLGVGLWATYPAVSWVFITMNFMLLAIVFFQKYLMTDNYYRILGDAVFLIPLFYLL